jgi:hypothetical protein
MRKFEFRKGVEGEKWSDYYRELGDYIKEYFAELAEEVRKKPTKK